MSDEKTKGKERVFYPSLVSHLTSTLPQYKKRIKIVFINDY